MPLPLLPITTHIENFSPWLTPPIVKYNAFTVGQESLLLQVKDIVALDNSMDNETKERIKENDLKSKMTAINQVVSECVISDHNVSDFPIFVIEKLLVSLREKSISEEMPITFKCGNLIEDEECGEKISITVKTEDIKIVVPEGHSTMLKIGDTCGIKLRYPTINYLFRDNLQLTNTDVILDCFDSIYYGDEVYICDDCSREELKNFYGSMSIADKKRLFSTFFNSMPHIHYETILKCPKCGYEHKIEFNRLQDFFI